MKLKIMTTEAIAYVKGNIDCLLDYYKNAVRPEKWLKEKLGKEPFIIVDALEFEDFQLQVSNSKPSADDAFNAKLLYSKFKTLNDSFASDERLWAGLSHTIFYEYLIKRWPNYYKKEDILNHFFFNQGKPRCYFVNTLSRLWWLGRKTYSTYFEDNWKIMDYISHDINGYAFTLFGSNWSNSNRTLTLFMKAIFKYESETKNKVYRELFNDVMKYTNCLGSIYIIDACDDDFVINNIYNYLLRRAEERIKEAEYNKLNNVKTSGVDKFDNIVKAINKIDGIGSLSQIYDAYSEIIGRELSSELKDYIKKSIYENFIDSETFKGNLIFYRLNIDDKILWKVANDYLIKDNYEKRNVFTKKQIESLTDNEKYIFNMFGAIRGNKISFDDIRVFKQQMMTVHPEIIDFESFIKENVRKLVDRGLLEKIDRETYKNSSYIQIK